MKSQATAPFMVLAISKECTNYIKSIRVMIQTVSSESIRERVLSLNHGACKYLDIFCYRKDFSTFFYVKLFFIHIILVNIERNKLAPKRRAKNYSERDSDYNTARSSQNRCSYVIGKASSVQSIKRTIPIMSRNISLMALIYLYNCSLSMINWRYIRLIRRRSRGIKKKEVMCMMNYRVQTQVMGTKTYHNIRKYCSSNGYMIYLDNIHPCISDKVLHRRMHFPKI